MNKPAARKLRCAVYTRKSSEEGLEQEFNSLDAQREACEAYVASQRSEGWVLIRDQYDDGGISGGTLERPALKRLLSDIEDGLVDVVVVYKIDRLSRSLMDFSKLVEVFDRNNVTFVSVTQSFNTTTSMGRLTLNILLSFAQFEREVTAERIRDKVKASRMKGIFMGGTPPYGYKPKDRKLVIDEEEARNVRWIFSRFLEIGSATKLAQEVAKKGIRTPRGNSISKNFLYRMLNNRAYIGEALMITGDLKRRIDALWTEFWQGGITNPLTVIEQITFLMFARLLDISETRDESRFRRTQKPFQRRFSDDEQDLRWSQFRHLGADAMLPLVRDRVFPHFRKTTAGGTVLAEFMKDAQLMIQKPALLVKAVSMIDQLPLTEGDAKGDLYEYLLGKLTTAGINGQFRTPRHIIRLMVEMLAPKPNELVADPSCGTGGFLVQTMQYLLETNTSPAGIIEEIDPETGKTEKLFTGDLLENHWDHIRGGMLHGFDFDATMLRIATMNLILHGIDSPDIHYQDTLSGSFTDRFPGAASDGFDVILANPPFKGMLDFEDVHPSLLRQVKTKKTELLFLVLILRMLKTGGRSATIVPDGVLFGSSTAHVNLRKLLLEQNQLEAVISLPSGVFKPYAGVSTGILVFTKGGRTDDVFFYDVEADGFSLDDKREPIDANDLQGCLTAWRNQEPSQLSDRKQKAFLVSAKEIREANYDLSLSRYKKRDYVLAKTDDPKNILHRMKALNSEIDTDLMDLESMLG